VHHLHLAADLRLEEAEAAVVGGEGLDVTIDDGAVDVATEQPEDARLALDLREQTGVAGDGIADERRPERLAPLPLVDGCFEVSDAPGLGLDLDLDAIRALEVQRPR
jgi:hypothetical protein